MSARPPWSEHDTQRLRAEIERRFTERTPPTRIDEVLPEQRVGRGEIRRWVSEQGMPPMPETDLEWGEAQARWYKQMSRRVRLAAGEIIKQDRRATRAERSE